MSEQIVTAAFITGMLIWFSIAVLVGFIVYRTTDRPRTGLLVGIGLFALPTWDLGPGLAMYSRYVDQLAGARIYGTVVADGYLDLGRNRPRGASLDLIIRTLLDAKRQPTDGSSFPYRYIEVRVDSPGSALDFVRQSGYWQFELQESGHPACDAFARWVEKVEYQRRGVSLSGSCLAAIRRDHPVSRYQVEREFNWQPLPGPPLLPPVKARFARVTDRTSGEIVAESYQLRYDSWFPMPLLDEYRPLSWITENGGPGYFRVADVIRPLRSD